MKKQKQPENNIIRKSVNLTPELAEVIESVAKMHGETFSAFMRAAALARLQVFLELETAKINLGRKAE